MTPTPKTLSSILPLAVACKLRKQQGRTIRAAIERGRLPAQKVGAHYYVSLADLDAYLESRWAAKPKSAKLRKRKAAKR